MNILNNKEQNMNTRHKEYIEKNIELIQNDRWKEFFLTAPEGVGTYLYHAGIDFMSVIKEAPQWCFAETDIDSVAIPNSVTKIGSGAFDNCTSLTSIIIPDSVTTIGNCAFRGCSRLESVDIPDSVITIGVQAFCKCTSLLRIIIPDNVTLIKGAAFGNCSSLTSITIGKGVTEIGKFALDGCTSLQTINFKGTTYQWEQISKYKEEFKFNNVPARKIICSDGVIDIT